MLRRFAVLAAVLFAVPLLAQTPTTTPEPGAQKPATGAAQKEAREKVKAPEAKAQAETKAAASKAEGKAKAAAAKPEGKAKAKAALSPIPGWHPTPVKNPPAKEIRAFLKQTEQAMSQGPEAYTKFVSFPVLMLTTNSKGEVITSQASREQYVKMMTMPPEAGEVMKNIKSQAPKLSWVTNELVWVEQPYTLRAAGKVWSWRSGMLLAKATDGWQVKAMAEGGWGDAMAPAKPAPAAEPAPAAQ